MACCGDRAPCSPRRILRISSRTNSPACVVGAFPARFALWAFSTVRFSGMVVLLAAGSDCAANGRVSVVQRNAPIAHSSYQCT